MRNSSAGNDVEARQELIRRSKRLVEKLRNSSKTRLKEREEGRDGDNSESDMEVGSTPRIRRKFYSSLQRSRIPRREHSICSERSDSEQNLGKSQSLTDVRVAFTTNDVASKKPTQRIKSAATYRQDNKHLSSHVSSSLAPDQHAVRSVSSENVSSIGSHNGAFIRLSADPANSHASSTGPGLADAKQASAKKDRARSAEYNSQRTPHDPARRHGKEPSRRGAVRRALPQVPGPATGGTTELEERRKRISAAALKRLHTLRTQVQADAHVSDAEPQSDVDQSSAAEVLRSERLHKSGIPKDENQNDVEGVQDASAFGRAAFDPNGYKLNCVIPEFTDHITRDFTVCKPLDQTYSVSPNQHYDKHNPTDALIEGSIDAALFTDLNQIEPLPSEFHTDSNLLHQDGGELGIPKTHVCVDHDGVLSSDLDALDVDLLNRLDLNDPHEHIPHDVANFHHVNGFSDNSLSDEIPPPVPPKLFKPLERTSDKEPTGVQHKSSPKKGGIRLGLASLQSTGSVQNIATLCESTSETQHHQQRMSDIEGVVRVSQDRASVTPCHAHSGVKQPCETSDLASMNLNKSGEQALDLTSGSDDVFHKEDVFRAIGGSNLKQNLPPHPLINISDYRIKTGVNVNVQTLSILEPPAKFVSENTISKSLDNLLDEASKPIPYQPGLLTRHSTDNIENTMRSEGNLTCKIFQSADIVVRQLPSESSQSDISNTPSLQRLVKTCDFFAVNLKHTDFTTNFCLIESPYFEGVKSNGEVYCIRPPTGRRQQIGPSSAFKCVSAQAPGSLSCSAETLSDSAPCFSLVALQYRDRSAVQIQGCCDGDFLLEVNGEYVLHSSRMDIEEMLLTPCVQHRLTVARPKSHARGAKNEQEEGKEVERMKFKLENMKTEAERNLDVIADLKLNLQTSDYNLKQAQNKLLSEKQRLSHAEKEMRAKESKVLHWMHEANRRDRELSRLKVENKQNEDQLVHLKQLLEQYTGIAYSPDRVNINGFSSPDFDYENDAEVSAV